MLRRAQSEPVPLARLEEALAAVWPGVDVISATPLAGGLGSVLHVIRLRGAPIRMAVLRQLLREFGDDDETVRREVAVHRAAHDAGVPVPAVHWSDPDGTVLGRPALLLDHVRGRPLVAGLATDPGRTAMARALHALRDVPVASLPGLPRLATLERVITRFGPTPEASDVVDAAALAAAVRGDVSAFDAGSRLVHLDLHAGNVVWDGSAVTGILDWPGAGVGNPLADEGYLWFDTHLAHGQRVADDLQAAVDAARPARDPTPAEVRLWRGVALLRGLPSPAPWAGAYRAMGIEIADEVVVERFVRLVEEHLRDR